MAHASRLGQIIWCNTSLSTLMAFTLFTKAGKSYTRCMRTFCQESCTFEDILGLRSRTFVAILEQELRIDDSRFRIEDEDWGSRIEDWGLRRIEGWGWRILIEEVLRMRIRIDDWGSRIEDWRLRMKIEVWGLRMKMEDKDWGTEELRSA